LKGPGEEKKGKKKKKKRGGGKKNQVSSSNPKHFHFPLLAEPKPEKVSGKGAQNDTEGRKEGKKEGRGT